MRSHTLARLRKRYEDASLQRKIALVMGIGGLLVTATMAIAAYLLSRQLIVANIQSTLGLHAQQKEREIFLRVDAALALARSLANNTVTANALADNLGRNTYLGPLFRSQNLPFPGATLTLTDYRARTVASSSLDDEVAHGAREQLIAETLRDVKPHALIPPPSDPARATIVAAFPVIYRLTGQPEGCVLLTIPLAELLPEPSSKYKYAILDHQQQPIAGQPGHAQAIEAAKPIALPAPLDQFRLGVTISQDRDSALQELDKLLVLFVVISGLLLIAVTVVSRAAARLLSAPLSDLAAAADRIGKSGRPDVVLEVQRNDEFGRLARGFQTMLKRLSDSYNELERRVEERTRALLASEQKMASILASLLDAVWSLSPDGSRIIYVSPAMHEMTALTLDDFGEQLAGFFAAVHDDDLPNFRSAIAGMVASHRAIDIEFRFHHPRKGLRVLQCRGHAVHDEAGRIMRFDGILTDVTLRSEAESRLRSRELYLRAILDNFPFPVWLKDADGRFLTVNKRFSTSCGIADPDTMCGLSDADVLAPDVAEISRQDDIEVMRSGHEKNIEEPFVIDGRRHWREAYKKPVLTSDGQRLGTVGFARDITARKEMERQLAESEQRWELAVTGSNDGIWDWHIASGELFLSGRWKSMLGYQDREISDRYEEWESRIHPADQALVQQEIARHLDGLSPLLHVEYRIRCKDERYRWMLARGKAVRDAAGRPLRLLGSQSDIHERIIAEWRLQHRTNQLNAIFALSPDGFVAFGESGSIEYSSPAFTEMTGLTTNDISGIDELQLLDRLAGLTHPESRTSQLTLDALRASKAPEDKHRQLLEICKPQARTLEIGRRWSEGSKVSKIFYFRDVTHETEVDRLKSEFLSTAAHELRTPMVSILGFSELLLNDLQFDTETKQELLETIYRQSTLMASIIDELLDLARIEARRGQDFIVEKIDLNGLILEATRSFRMPDDERCVHVEPLDREALIHGDRRKVTQAVTNVLSNAYKYSPDGGAITLSLEARERLGRPGFCVVVRDEGIGMSAETLNRVCERFFRADTSGRILGTGLGMSIVREIVELHGGHLTIASQPGQGSEVALWFPEDAEAVAPAPSHRIMESMTT